MSDPRTVIARFAEVRAVAEAKYGSESQAVTFLYYEELISARAMLAADPSSELAGHRAGELTSLLQARFTAGGAIEPRRPYHRTAATDPMIIEYDRERFELQYRQLLDGHKIRAVRLTSRTQAMATLIPRSSYLYVVDEAGSLLVWPEPRRLADVMFGWVPGRPPEPGRVVHPMLVPDRLRVRAAGELVVVGSVEQVGVVANLRSGHFRPPASCAPEFRRAVVAALELTMSNTVDVFTMPEPVGATRT